MSISYKFKMNINLLNKLSEKNVLVIGDYCVDEFWYGENVGIAPAGIKSKVPRFLEREVKTNPGMTGNIAAGISALGAKCYAAGVIGNDEASKILISFFNERRIDYKGMIFQEDRITSRFLRNMILSDNNPPEFYSRWDRENHGKMNENSSKSLIKFIETIGPSFDAIVVADYNEHGEGIINPEILNGIRETAKKENIFLIGDSRKNFNQFEDFTCIKPNLKEAGQLYRGEISSLEESAQEIIKALNLKSLLVTKDNKGMEIFTREGLRKSFPTYAENIVSVDGAGDTVTCAFTLGVISGLGYVDATKLASYAAAIAVSKPGVDVVTFEELKNFTLSRENK